MPKAEAGTPKYEANRQKSKGLQKLRWYCQVCQKQCRDENGYKCHINSESHQRQLLVVADNPDVFLNEYSSLFLEGFMDLLKRRFGTKRVYANLVYQEYIAFKEHIHMNATQWETLTELVKYLGRAGLAIADHTEKGWFITYVDRDPETLARQERIAKKERMDKDDDERRLEIIQRQIEKDKLNMKETAAFTELVRENEDDKVEFLMPAKPMMATDPARPTTSAGDSANPLLKRKGPADRWDDDGSKSGSSNGTAHHPARSDSDPSSGLVKLKSNGSTAGPTAKRSALDDIRREEEGRKERMNRKDHWLHPNIVVKVMTDKLGPEFMRQKGIVKEVPDRYTGVVKLTSSGKSISIDQKYLETIIPAIGRQVLVVNGAYRGEKAVIKGLDEKSFSAFLTIDEGLMKGRDIKLPYEDFSKLHV